MSTVPITSSVTRTCPLCEAMCGLVLDLDADRQVVRVRGDRDDPYSRGFLCPKGASLGHVDRDPDRLTTPLVRVDGELRPATWDEAFAEVARLVRPVVAEHGHDAIGSFLGNAVGHDFGIPLYTPVLMGALRSKHVYSASTLDNMPHNVVAALLFGNGGTIPVPDLDRTDLFVIVGGNPLVSNGSVGSAPDYPGRLRALQERGGRLVVVDPARTATAALADEHIPIRPGTDALMLLAMVHTLFDEELVATDSDAVRRATGLDAVRIAVAPFGPEAVSSRCRVDAETIRRLTRELAAARHAAVYGRLGTTLSSFGTVTNWAIALLNVLTGHLDRPGGMMFPESVAGSPTTRKARGPGSLQRDRYRSSVRGAPEVLGELPAACMAEEILSAGPDRLRCLVVVGGNPARSIPNSAAVEAALARLDALVCVDPYLNETSRLAHVVLPPTSLLARPHFDMLLTNYSLRNVAKFSPAVRPVPDGELQEWQILVRLANAIDPQSAPSVEEVDSRMRARLVRSVAEEIDVPAAEIEAALGDVEGPLALLDLRVRAGPFGDHFGRRPGVSLESLGAVGHTVDLGALRSRLDEVIRTESGSIELAPRLILDDLPRLATMLTEEVPALLMIGRRTLRSKNSWLHNISVLVKGKPRCTLKIHPDDAARAGVLDGADAIVRSAVGEVRALVEVDEGMANGVCSLPHGWGHQPTDTGRSVALRHAGTNSNALADDSRLDPLSGIAVLNAIPVSVAPA